MELGITAARGAALMETQLIALALQSQTNSYVHKCVSHIGHSYISLIIYQLQAQCYRIIYTMYYKYIKFSCEARNRIGT